MTKWTQHELQLFHDSHPFIWSQKVRKSCNPVCSTLALLNLGLRAAVMISFGWRRLTPSHSRFTYKDSWYTTVYFSKSRRIHRTISGLGIGFSTFRRIHQGILLTTLLHFHFLFRKLVSGGQRTTPSTTPWSTIVNNNRHRKSFSMC